ncbi:MAG TPA: hypothetical protein VHC95_01380, partial [Opitutales bacterium]|nr:hypothetical protein [Opitutales bacterium]
MSEPASKPALLYLSINDGSDTRINKEIATLSRDYAIDFVGVAASTGQPFIASQVRSLNLIHGSRRSLLTMARLLRQVRRLRRHHRYASVHVINENFYLLLWLLLRGEHVVLDIFDSMFLKTALPRWLVRLGQRFCYAKPAKIIVTDDERAALMPDFARAKLVILPNYPFRYEGPRRARDSAHLRILYVGSLSEPRGTAFARKLLEAAEEVRVVMAGWQYDEESKALAR